MNMIMKANDNRWNEYIERLPVEKQDIYYTREYYCMEQEEGHGEAFLFVCENDNGQLGLYPFLRNPVERNYLDKTYYDIETAYGYGGPLVNSMEPEFIEEFETAFLQYCKAENIIAEFIRFHPLLKNETIFKKEIQVLHNRYTVWLDLTKDLDDIWMNQVSKQNRNTIRKSEKNGLIVEVSSDYEQFVEIYEQTMQKVAADSFYYFDQTYYEVLKNNENMVLLCVKKEEELIAAAIFMCYQEYCHYHLAGSRREFLKLSPNNLLLWGAIKYAKEQGCKRFHFGGGLTDSKEDNLFRFKSKYSKDCADFFIGKRVHNHSVYDLLIKEWEEQHGGKAKLLLQYRE